MGYYDNSGNTGNSWMNRPPGGAAPPSPAAPPAPPPGGPRARPQGYDATTYQTNTPTYGPGGQVTFAAPQPAGAPPPAVGQWGRATPPPPPPAGPQAPVPPPSPYGPGYNANGTVGAGDGYYGAPPPSAPGALAFTARSGRGHF